MPLKERKILSRLFSFESRKSSENVSKNAGNGNVCGCSSIHVCTYHYSKLRLSEAQPKERGAKAAQMPNIYIQRRPKGVAYG